MDPKMDSGCLEPGESLDEDYDVTRPLLPGEVLGVIDQLLCLEVGELIRQRLGKTQFANRTWPADGLAPRLPALPDAVHQRLHRKDAGPGPQDHPGG